MAMHVAVVGGGLTGLVAARRLREQGVEVTVLDRGPLLGGRLRRRDCDLPGYGRAAFDPVPPALGPAGYPPNDPAAPVGLPAIAIRGAGGVPGLAAKVCRTPVTHVSPGGGAPLPALTTVAGGSRALLDLLLPRGCDEHLAVRNWTEAVAVEPHGAGWVVRTRECGPAGSGPGPTGTVRADAVLLTQPAPDALGLLDASGVACHDAVRDEVRGVRYSRTLVLTVACCSGAQAPAGLLAFAGSPLAMLFDNRTTGASPVGPALTAVAAEEWAEAHWGESDEEIARQLLPLVAPWGEGEVLWHSVRRVERYRPTGRLRMPFAELSDLPPLILAGDGFAGYVDNPLDAAYTSATYAVAHLCRTLGRIARLTERPTPRTPARPVLEVAVSSECEARAATESGADRLLVLAAPEYGGLTPSLDAFLAVRRVARHAGRRRGRPVPVAVLLRPRLGNCVYAHDELAQMTRDAARFLKAGADGIAFGALSESGGEARVDADACRPLVAAAHGAGKEAVFHRAFDLLHDRRTGLQDLIALGFDRVVTAGRWKLAIDGTADLAADVAYAGWDIQVVVAGGITADTAGYVVWKTNCRHLLGGFREPRSARSGRAIDRFGGSAARAFVAERVAATAAALGRSGEVPPSDSEFDPESEEDIHVVGCRPCGVEGLMAQ